MLEFNQSYDGGYQPQYNSGEATGNKKQLTQPVDQEAKEYIGRCVFTPKKLGMNRLIGSQLLQTPIYGPTGQK